MKRNLSKRINSATELLHLKYDNNPGLTGLSSAREKAQRRFKKFGIPLTKDEYWKFSSPERFTSLEFQNEQKSCKSVVSKDINHEDVNIFFIDGVLDQSYADLNDLHAVKVNMHSISIYLYYFSCMMCSMLKLRADD